MAEHARVQPKWQRAKVIAHDADFHDSTVWVTGSPFAFGGYDCRTLEPCRETLTFETNLLEPFAPFAQVTVKAESVELMPDFADDVPLISWEQFLQECRKHLP